MAALWFLSQSKLLCGIYRDRNNNGRDQNASEI